jgi:hypothetical protein
MISDLHTLECILQELCQEGKIVPRTTLFIKYESLTNSGMEIYKFKKAISFLIKNKTITGYELKPGRNGGVYKVPDMESIKITTSSGKFTGYISKSELLRLISNLKKHQLIESL